MSEPIVWIPSTNSGQELQLSDVDNLGAVAGLADNRVLAELLRLASYSGGPVAKCIIPFTQSAAPGQAGLQANEYGTVMPSLSANGSVLVNPFRAVVGPRNAYNAAPSPNPAVGFQSNQLASWRDIRSGVFVGTAFYAGTGANVPQQIVTLAPNSSGLTRWDLIYATVAVDANGPSVTRRIKNPSTGVITPTAVASYLNSPVSIAVVVGTPGSSPVPPSLPADAGGNYNIGIALVRVPNGFSSSSTVATGDIRAFAGENSQPLIYPLSAFQHVNARMDVQPATGNNDLDGTYAANFPWGNASAAGRPGCFMPPDWGGGRQVMVELDLVTGGAYSHLSGGIVDSSINWLNRMILAVFQVNVNKFANDQSGSTTRAPYALEGTGFGAPATFTALASTFSQDGAIVASTSSVLYIANASSTYICSLLASGSSLGLYVDPTGVLKAYVSATTPGVRVFAWLMASGQFPNA